MTSARLEELLAAFPKARIAVLGDFFLDLYYEVDPGLAELSLETGKVAHQVIGVKHSPGAAGTVTGNLVALRGGPDEHPTASGTLCAIGFTGKDGNGFDLRRDLEALGVDTTQLHTDTDPGRRTPVYLKPWDTKVPGLQGEHSRYDIKNRKPTSEALRRKIEKSLVELFDRVDALIVMDQAEDDGFGTVTSEIRSRLDTLLAAEPGKMRKPIVWADSRRRIHDFPRLHRKMNQFEFLGIHNPAPGETVPEEKLAAAFSASHPVAPIFVTGGEKGVWIRAAEGSGSASGPGTARGSGSVGTAGMIAAARTTVFVPAVKISGPVDPTGAGDSFTAGAVLALVAGASLEEAALMGNLAASVTVRKLGTTGTASPDEIRRAFAEWKEQVK